MKSWVSKKFKNGLPDKVQDNAEFVNHPFEGWLRRRRTRETVESPSAVSRLSLYRSSLSKFNQANSAWVNLRSAAAALALNSAGVAEPARAKALSGWLST